MRDAISESRTPPKREADPDVADAQRGVAVEDAEYARAELAIVSCDVLAAIRDRRQDFDEALYLGASPELRVALGGFEEHERLRVERLRNVAAEPQIVDLSNPSHAPFTELGSQEAVNA
ncbi:MAG TPA: hypothetical protein VII01_01800 [Solirubrobacteraceae bacterium]